MVFDGLTKLFAPILYYCNIDFWWDWQLTMYLWSSNVPHLEFLIYLFTIFSWDHSWPDMTMSFARLWSNFCYRNLFLRYISCSFFPTLSGKYELYVCQLQLLALGYARLRCMTPIFWISLAKSVYFHTLGCSHSSAWVASSFSPLFCFLGPVLRGNYWQVLCISNNVTSDTCLTFNSFWDCFLSFDQGCTWLHGFF